MYLLFAGDNYYPQGGWRDIQGIFLSIESAKEQFNQPKYWGDSESPPKYEWGHIVDTRTMDVIEYL
jgi:hypothetical protein